jgi:hypothetical protein
MNDITSCACGCGRETNIAPGGEPRRYVRGHNRRGRGIGWIEGGYRYVSVDGRKIAFHRWVMEQTCGHRLTSDEIVHHVDGDRLNNGFLVEIIDGGQWRPRRARRGEERGRCLE